MLGTGGVAAITSIRPLQRALVGTDSGLAPAPITLMRKGRLLSLDVVDGELALDVQPEPEKLLPAIVE